MHRMAFQSLLLAIFITSTAFAADPQEVERFLKEFHANPAKALQAPLPKWGSDGNVLHTSKSSLGSGELARSFRWCRRNISRALKEVPQKIQEVLASPAPPEGFSLDRMQLMDLLGAEISVDAKRCQDFVRNGAWAD